MNKKIFITIGVVLIIIVAGVWVYLFFSGKTSTSDGVFAQFGDGGDVVDVAENMPTTPENAVVDTTPKRLRQLTFLRPVAGATLTETGALYVEQGTGHVFHINLTSGNETLVSGTTIPGAREALFSHSGTYVAITHYINGVPETILGSVSVEGGLEGISLPRGAKELSFDENGERLYYLLAYENGTRGYSYNIANANAVELFDIPLRDIHVIWGEDVYVYTTPSSKQIGYVYSVDDRGLNYLTKGGRALTALVTTSGLVVTRALDSAIVSSLAGTDGLFLDPMLPEKCVSLTTSTLCAVPPRVSASDFPDVWYQGLVSYADNFWEIDIVNNSAQLVLNPLLESGREIDVFQIGVDKQGVMVWFINKNDNSLWLYDTSL